MSRVVVDTNIVSFIFKRDTRASLYYPHLEGGDPVISFMTLAELYRWGLEKNWGKTRWESLKQELTGYILFPFNRHLCMKWAEACHSARRAGKPISEADAWIAATALLYDIPLITHNRSDYGGVAGLEIISEMK